jgi:hypothetical protein
MVREPRYLIDKRKGQTWLLRRNAQFNVVSLIMVLESEIHRVIIFQHISRGWMWSKFECFLRLSSPNLFVGRWFSREMVSGVFNDGTIARTYT